MVFKCLKIRFPLYLNDDLAVHCIFNYLLQVVVLEEEDEEDGEEGEDEDAEDDADEPVA